MAKNSKGRRRRKNSKQYDSDNDDESLEEKEHSSAEPKNEDTKYHNKKSDLTFAERRELQRKSAADKRRQKMKASAGIDKTKHRNRDVQ